MRWPIRLQLLLPILAVVVSAVFAVSATSAWFVATQARRQQHENVRRLCETVAEGGFPVTETVLQQMSGLSGAQFVLFDAEGQVRSTTVRLGEEDRSRLGRLNLGPSGGAPPETPVVDLEGKPYLAERLPVAPYRGAPHPGWLLVLYPEGQWSSAIRNAVYPVLAIGLLTVTVVVVVTTVLAQRFLGRIRRLGDRTAAIAEGDFTPVPVGRRNDEVRDLALSINRMTEKLGLYETEVRRSERLRTLGQLGAGMAHQLRNSATGALMAIELHQRGCTAANRESLDVAARQMKLMESYLQRFLSLGSSHRRPHEEVALETIVEDVLELVQPACAHAKIEAVRRVPGEPINVRGDPESLRQLLSNLVTNAIEAAGRGGAAPARVTVELACLGRDRAVLCVEDSGLGPAAETRDNLFDPFVSEKPDGTGLGLPVAEQIAREHEGSIRWERRDRTTCFTVELPLLHPRADHGAPVGG
jgi:signal transduction histidine kinase